MGRGHGLHFVRVGELSTMAAASGGRRMRARSLTMSGDLHTGRGGAGGRAYPGRRRDEEAGNEEKAKLVAGGSRKCSGWQRVLLDLRLDSPLDSAASHICKLRALEAARALQTRRREFSFRF